VVIAAFLKTFIFIVPPDLGICPMYEELGCELSARVGESTIFPGYLELPAIDA
jgi:hypothetical protein